MVAGAMAILMTQYPTADNRTLRNALRMGAQQLPGREKYDPETGFGLLRIRNSLQILPQLESYASSVLLV